ncbi:OmpA family protein [uncultured Oceanicoccus sp.]|uniref:OmpA family protein n=1 Tax=uncultured Oceanicoccus sp. TaxID=1706381 RepID=UPI0030DC1C71
MKMPMFLPALGMCFMASTLAMADTQQTTIDAKRLGIVTSSVVIGVATMGPIGAIPGLMAGDWLDQEIMDADRVEEVEAQLSAANSHIEQLGDQLATYQLSTQHYARIALEQLQLELMFRTNNSDLTEQGIERLSFLAKFLSENPDIHIRLDGYADPRGDAEENQRLSEQRVSSVFDLLVDNGVDDSRIKKYSHGASQSLSVPGDYDSYALDRVVKIQLFQPDQEAFAGVMIAE